jgi:hypothetical protein
MIHTHTEHRYIDEEHGIDVVIPSRPEHDEDVLFDEENREIRYLTHDETFAESYEWPEGIEFVQSNSRWANYTPDPEGWLERVNSDPTLDVYPVGVFEHGQVRYALAGESIHSNDQWDYCVGACIAVPNMVNGQGYTDTGKAARAILEEYTAWCNGEVYALWRVNVDTSETDVVGGYIGWDQAEQARKEGY